MSTRGVFRICYLFYALALVASKTLESGSTIVGGNCVVPIGSIHHNRFQWPLIYQDDGKLYPTQTDAEEVRSVQVPAGAHALLSCGPNYLKHYNRKEVLKVQCQTGGKFSVVEGATSATDVAAKSVEQFACDLRVVEEVLHSVDGCTNDQWTATVYGYVNPNDRQTYILGEACYDEHEGRTIFAHVKLGAGEASSYLQKQPHNYLTRQRHPDGRYKIELFRGLHFDEFYERIRQSLHLRRAPFMHKANYIDELLLPNAQFRAVQKLGWNYFVAHDDLEAWNTLKADIRQLSATQDLDVYVGAHGIQTLRGATDDLKLDLYLQPAAGEHGKFPVPALLWIVVKTQQGSKSIAFAVYNEAARNAVEDGAALVQREAICQSKCSSVSWLSQTLKQQSAGGNGASSIICCAVKDFRKTIKEVPALGGVQELLN